MSKLITLTSRQYAQLRGITGTAVRNAARNSIDRPKKEWWSMPGVDSFEHVGDHTWIFYCLPEWVTKRREVLGIK